MIEVDAIHTGRHSLFGVFCKGDADLANAYIFALDSTGSCTVGRMQGGSIKVLGTGTDPAIEPGIAVNHIRADCFDKEPIPNPLAELRMWINGTMVYATQDEESFSGPKQSTPGLFFETDFEGDTKIVFDNFIFLGVDPDTLDS